MEDGTTSRGRGRRPLEECVLTDEQRARLGVDRFLTVPEIATILQVCEENVRNAITAGKLPAFYVPSKSRRGREMVEAVKGWRVIIWCDSETVGRVSDGDERNFKPKVREE
jgi:hypothetical protein